MPRIITNLWFDTEALEAAELYCSIFPDSAITRVAHCTEAGPGPAGSVVTVDFHLDGTPFTAINGGPRFPFTEAVSLLVDCADQVEVDRYWDALSAGGETSQCGWLKDRYGLSWQVCPDELAELMTDPDPLRVERVTRAMLAMTKIDVAALRAAADGGEAGEG
jgi:predicted 3-demethylubiquinone-9 3-methyltransferase (glyoxalase superfamily)